jgi:hypothetical protein
VLDQCLRGRCSPAGRELLESLAAMREADPSFVADVLLNPREATYEVEEFMDLLRDAGLRFVEWLYPASWRLPLYSDDADLARRFEALGPIEQAAFIQRFAGLAGPLLEVLVERDDAPVRAPYTRDERLAMRMLRSPGAREIEIEGSKLRSEHALAPYDISGEMITGTIRTNTPPGRTWALSAGSRRLLEAFDGEKSVAEIAEAFAKEVDTETLLNLIGTLGPTEVGLLAPVWA